MRAAFGERPVNLHRLDLVSLSLFNLVVGTGSISKGAALANLAVGALAVLDERADLRIFADRTPPLGLQTVPYRNDRLVLVVPKAHPLAARKAIDFVDAADFEFVSLAASTSLAQRMQSEAEAVGKRLRLRIQVRSFDAMCQMVAAGLGVAVLPDAAIQPHLRSMGLRKIDLRDAWVHRTLLLGARDLKALPRPARVLLDHLLKGRARRSSA
jgi:DNA-binding transcriptional LysR family regulator